MVDSSDNKEYSQSQHPALLIGMGGTGKQVLLNLRRMFFERYGKATLPHLAHLWIDTDLRDITLDGEETDFLMKEVDFKSHEKLDVELKRSDLSDYYNHPDAYPHIFSWFDQRLQRIGEVRDGAGAVRSFGRLAFFHNYQNIKDRLISKRTELENAAAHNQARKDHGIVLDNSSLDVWLIFSVAGGTGSGMFLDMAFAIRQTWRRDVNIRGIIVLPSVFSSDTSDRIYANAYAALMELEHYSFDKDGAKISAKSDGLHSFRCAWTKEQYKSSKNSMSGPVFDTAYLIDNKPDGSGGSIGLQDKNSLCRMLAEWLYIEYATGPEVEPLGNRRRGDESNLEVSKLRPIRYDYATEGFSEIFSSRFSTLGLSKISIPLNRTHISVHYRLARDMVEFWSYKRDIPASLDEKIEKEYLHRLRVDNSSRHNDFIRALEIGSDNERLTNRLQKKLVENRNQFISMVGSADVRSRIDRWVDDKIIGELLEYGSTKNERRGVISKLIESNAENHYDAVKESLNNLMGELLAIPEYRFEVSRELLRRTRDRLLHDQERFIQIRDVSRNRSNISIKETQERLEWLDDVSGNFTRKTLIEVALDLIEVRAKSELKAQVADISAELAQKLADYIGVGKTEKNAQGEDIQVETGLLKKLQDHQSILQWELVHELEDRVNAFNTVESSLIFQDLGEGQDESDRFYIDEGGKPITEGTLSEWEVDFFEEQQINEPVTLWTLYEVIQTDGRDRMIERLVNFSRKKMHYLRDHQVDVLERLCSKDKPGSSGYQATIKRLIDYSQPWLPEPNHHIDSEQIRQNKKSFYWVARKDSSGSEQVKAFDGYLSDHMVDTPGVVSTSSDRIYAASEVCGLPLMVIADLDQYRDLAYLPYLQASEVIHTDLAFEKFQDLLIKQPGEVQTYIQTLKIFLQAILLGVVQVEQEQDQAIGNVLNFEYIDTRGLFDNNQHLGPFTVAIQSLSSDNREMREMLAQIKSSVDGILADMRDDDLRRWYPLLGYHAEHPDSFFYRFSKEHAVRVQLKSMAEDVLQSSPFVEEHAAEWLDDIKKWTKEFPPNSGLLMLNLN